jgi:hypothetical protein
MAFELNRIDGKASRSQVRPENVVVRGDEALLELLLSPVQSIEIYFPTPRFVKRELKCESWQQQGVAKFSTGAAFVLRLR